MAKKIENSSMKKYIFALFLGLSAMVQAQNSLSGTVTDETNHAVVGVSVYIPELHKGTITDANGNYSFKNLPNGSLKINFEYVGYASQNHEIAKLQLQNTLNVQLLTTTFHMDEVIISTAFNKIQSQNVMKVEHASIYDLEKKGTATLMEGLATIPGVAQVSTGTSIGKPVIRGLSGNRVLVYSQGVK